MRTSDPNSPEDTTSDTTGTSAIKETTLAEAY